MDLNVQRRLSRDVFEFVPDTRPLKGSPAGCGGSAASRHPRLLQNIAFHTFQKMRVAKTYLLQGHERSEMGGVCL